MTVALAIKYCLFLSFVAAIFNLFVEIVVSVIMLCISCRRCIKAMKELFGKILKKKKNEVYSRN